MKLIIVQNVIPVMNINRNNVENVDRPGHNFVPNVIIRPGLCAKFVA